MVSNDARHIFFKKMLDAFSMQLKPREVYGEYYFYCAFGLADNFRDRSDQIRVLNTENCVFTVYLNKSLPTDFSAPEKFQDFRIIYKVSTKVPEFFSTNCDPDDV